MVIIRTTFGEIKLELDAEKAPKTVANFLGYAQEGYYDGTIFHRVIDNFMILPDGTIARNMDAIGNAADNPREKVFGAAQVQIVFDSYTTSDERNEILRTLIEANLPILDAIRLGANR